MGEGFMLIVRGRHARNGAVWGEKWGCVGWEMGLCGVGNYLPGGPLNDDAG